MNQKIAKINFKQKLDILRIHTNIICSLEMSVIYRFFLSASSFSSFMHGNSVGVNQKTSLPELAEFKGFSCQFC